MIISPQQLLLQTLEFFGLPKNYMNGAGHWKDWEKKKKEEQKAASLRKPKKNIRKIGRKRQEDKNKEDEFKVPFWFDLVPFQSSFKKFVSVPAELRTQFKATVEANLKKIVLEFCN